MDFQEGHRYVAVSDDCRVTLYPARRFEAVGRNAPSPLWYVEIESDGLLRIHERKLTIANVRHKVMGYDIEWANLEWASEPSDLYDLCPYKVRYYKVQEKFKSQYVYGQRVIYFAEAVGSGRIKIGSTNEPDVRIDILATTCPFPLDILAMVAGTMKQERSIHRQFAHLRTHLEWFQDAPELREYIASL